MKKYFYQIFNTIDLSADFKKKELRLKVEDCREKEDFAAIFNEEITFTQMALFRAQSMARMLPTLIFATIALFIALWICSLWFPEATAPMGFMFAILTVSVAVMLILTPHMRSKELKVYLKYLYSLNKMDITTLRQEFTSDDSIDFAPKAKFTGENKELCVLFKKGGFEITNERAFFSALSKIIADKNNKQFHELHKTYNKLESEGYTEQLKLLRAKFLNN